MFQTAFGEQRDRAAGHRVLIVIERHCVVNVLLKNSRGFVIGHSRSDINIRSLIGKESECESRLACPRERPRQTFNVIAHDKNAPLNSEEHCVSESAAHAHDGFRRKDRASGAIPFAHGARAMADRQGTRSFE